MTIATKMTAAEFLALPEDPRKTRYELVHGEVVVSPSPNFDHSYVFSRLFLLLGNHIERKKLGILLSELDTCFDSNDVRRPDIIFFTSDRQHLIVGPYPLISPDLCIEILSPSNMNDDRIAKFKLYQDCAVPFYWIVDPMSRSIEGYHLLNGLYGSTGRGQFAETISLPPFDDLPINLATLWRPSLDQAR